MTPEQMERAKVMYLRKISKKLTALLWVVVPYALYRFITWSLAFIPWREIVARLAAHF